MAGKSGAMRELVSNTSTAESGSSPRSNDSIVWSTLSSRIWKFFLCKVEDGFACLAVEFHNYRRCAKTLQNTHADRAFGCLLHGRAGLGGNRPLGLWENARAKPQTRSPAAHAASVSQPNGNRSFQCHLPTSLLLWRQKLATALAVRAAEKGSTGTLPVWFSGIVT